tara:strand:- start:332 stop:649 length:318 start_codon:yes stop_codon:yes gene_type:complete
MKVIYEKYILGVNAKDNWDILDTIDDDNYYFFHLRSFPSPYVILCEKSPTVNEIKLGAEICKSNSKYRNLKNIYVDYCVFSNIIKGDKLGEIFFRSLRKVKNIKV